MKKASIVSLISLLSAVLSKTALRLLPAAALVLLPVSCKPIELGLYKVFDHGESVDERIGDLDDVPAPNPAVSNGKFAFAVTSDVHFGNDSPSYSRDEAGFYAKLQELKSTLNPPSFLVCLGDVVEKGDARQEWADYRDWCQTVESILGNKVYTTTGNHDLYNNGWEYFEDYTYPGTGLFRFSTAGFTFYFLDSGSGSLGSKQFSKFRKAVEADGSPKIICTHYPVYGTAQFFQNYYTMQNTEEADTLITLCTRNNVKLFLGGHMHAQHENDLGSFTELVLPCYAVDHKFAVVTVDTVTHTTSQTVYSY